ncbi:MAG: 4'-phosphopantetheinyl transferase superfamily protein [Muribaculaceae bacterium]|nr:4'-phosphopantetheinyl transferase superfamily protein [Muribaculaceae bacterium]
MKEFSHDDIKVAVMTFAEAEPLLAREPGFKGLPDDSRLREQLVTTLLLRRCLGDRAADSLRHDADGAPFLADSGLNISISHSRHEVAVGWSPTVRIGIDAESPRPALQRVAPRFLTPRERRHYTTLPHLLRAWTIKEAVYKAMHIKDLTSQQIELSCATQSGGKDYATVGDETLTVLLHELEGGSLLAVAIRK